MHSDPRPSRVRRFARDAWQLLLPYWRSEERRSALGLLAVIVLLNLGAVYVLVLLNAWNRSFYDALEQRDAAAFAHQLGRFCLFAAAFIATAVYRQYLTQLLEMRWRRWLTHQFLDTWLGGGAYHRLERTQRRPDNPDQRIAEDLQALAGGTLALAMGLLNAVVTLVSFVGILWGLSGPLTIRLGGGTLTIPAYLVWAAVLYAVAGSLLTHRIGRALVRLHASQQRREADFRFSLVRLRETAEEVALSRGEPLERRSLRGRFAAIVDNWWQLLRAQKRLTWFTTGYGQAAHVFPILAAAPRYFAGAIQLGGLMQIASAFGRVQEALSWFVDSYGQLAEWKASVARVLAFAESMRVASVDASGSGGIRIVHGSPDEIALDDVDIALPAGAMLLRGANVVISRGERVLLAGPSGSGKSTVFRAVAGLWPCGTGEIRRPDAGDTLFLPQRPYLPIGSLRQAVAYPSEPGTVDDAAIVSALERCRLGKLVDRLEEEQHWAQVLSPGEQQLVALARAFLHAPPWLFLDEATSALDEATEAHVYRELGTQLPDTTIVSIAHRPGVAAYHERRLVLAPEGDVMTIQGAPPAPARAAAC
ncbi:MAG TPA: ABC transporter ATP-binding protein/permease [Candidatus Eisenbacteria bacterium]|nr:ABC transporter ATP-binding protein/permease [Candidatus Eisenbacteria bacterium]